jgi:hypothetical protein
MPNVSEAEFQADMAKFLEYRDEERRAQEESYNSGSYDGARKSRAAATASRAFSDLENYLSGKYACCSQGDRFDKIRFNK